MAAHFVHSPVAPSPRQPEPALPRQTAWDQGDDDTTGVLGASCWHSYLQRKPHGHETLARWLASGLLRRCKLERSPTACIEDGDLEIGCARTAEMRKHVFTHSPHDIHAETRSPIRNTHVIGASRRTDVNLT